MTKEAKKRLEAVTNAETCWVMVNWGHILVWTAQHTKKDCISEFERITGKRWEKDPNWYVPTKAVIGVTK